ncbi:peroxiredoxin [Staphylococcus aureus]|nr:peroxiredoxin [Staphylococcus aureus]
MAIHYETKATNVGGRKGHVYTDDRAIDIDIVPPAQADGKATNPEQLFAAGYASCFNGAFDLILKQNKVRDAHPEVTLTVRLEDDPDSESPKLSVSIDATLKMLYLKKKLKNIYKWLMNFVHIQKRLKEILMSI